MTPHKHAELIKAWADGAKIQMLDGKEWWDSINPAWHLNNEYRIKPEPKLDRVVVLTTGYTTESIDSFWCYLQNNGNLKLTFDCETGKLKLAEVLK